MAVVTVEVILGLLCVCVWPSLTSPVKTYDQRQHGDLNIHAQLDNIVVVVIPSARLNLLELAMDTKFSGEKGGFMQLLQKLHKAEIDRYDIVKDKEELPTDSSAGGLEIDIKRPIPVITSAQQVSFNNDEENGDKEEEVVATVEEMKPDIIKTTEPSKSEATEDVPLKAQSSVSGVVHDSVLIASVPEEEKDNVNAADNKTKDSSQQENETEKQTKPPAEQKNVNVKTSTKQDTITTEKLETSYTESSKPLEVEGSSKNIKPEETSTKLLKEEGLTIEDYIKPVAAKEEISSAPSAVKKTQFPEEHLPKKSVEPVRLQEGVRKDKVIRYKPESKWAPEIVDLLGPPRTKPKVQERQMFADLCSPGVWDPELRTCIMPGETRSRSELARFLSAMRFGIEIPK